MARQWVDITTIDNNTPFTAVRWKSNWNLGDTWFAESSGLTTDYMGWTDGTSQYGWFSAHRMNSNEYSCSFIHSGDSYWNDEGAIYQDHVKDTIRAAEGYYDSTITIDGETYYEIDFTLWSGGTNVPLYAPYATMPWNPGDVYVYAGVPDISVTPTKITFNSQGGNKTVRVSSLSAWTAVTFDTWVNFSPSAGTAGDTDVTITADPYTGTTDRGVNVMFSWTSAAGINATVSVYQKPPSTGVNGLYIGTENVEGLYLGTEEVQAMYIGDVQIF